MTEIDRLAGQVKYTDKAIAMDSDICRGDTFMILNKHNVSRSFSSFSISLLSATSLLLCGTSLAADPITQSLPDFSDRTSYVKKDGFHLHKVNEGFRVRGWELAEHVYFGHAKVAGKSGVGLLVDKGSVVYGVNNRGVSFMLRF